MVFGRVGDWLFIVFIGDLEVGIGFLRMGIGGLGLGLEVVELGDHLGF